MSKSGSVRFLAEIVEPRTGLQVRFCPHGELWTGPSVRAGKGPVLVHRRFELVRTLSVGTNPFSGINDTKLTYEDLYCNSPQN
jgi:hypothetical protein